MNTTKGRLAFNQQGLSNSHVVLLHSLGLDLHVWSSVAATLATSVQVISYDLPGHGKSPTLDCHDINEFADIVATDMKLNQHLNAIVVGMSFGGSVAIALAARHPDSVSGLVLIDTTAWYGTRGKETWAYRMQEVQSKGLSALAQKQLKRWVSDDFRLANPVICARLENIFVSNQTDGYVNGCRALGAMDLRESARHVRAPAEILVGEFDSATPATYSEDLNRRIPRSTLRIVPGCRHLSAIERPDAVIEAVARVSTKPGT